MSKRVGYAVGLASCLSIAAIASQTRLEARATPWCRVFSDTYAYNYGDPPEFLGRREWDYAEWRGNISLSQCVDLAGVAVKQWGKELCDQYSAGYARLEWFYNYWDSNTYVHVEHFNQQYDCGDLP